MKSRYITESVKRNKKKTDGLVQKVQFAHDTAGTCAEPRTPICWNRVTGFALRPLLAEWTVRHWINSFPGRDFQKQGESKKAKQVELKGELAHTDTSEDVIVDIT
ncbi:hypothetical protein BaRGS_00001983, partial [Batillaria attramentaria]